jgi:hypothetical protein
MIETIKAKFHKLVVGAMVVINMSPMPLKVIGKEACLCARGPFGLLKDRRPKRCPNI